MAYMSQTERDGVTILRLTGSMTSEALEQVESNFHEITHRPGMRVVVDLTSVDLVTTPALSMFVSAATFAKQNGGVVVFTESQPPVRDVLRRLRLHTVLRTVPGFESALRQAQIPSPE
jgi:anti-anti-sigma factor